MYILITKPEIDTIYTYILQNLFCVWNNLWWQRLFTDIISISNYIRVKIHFKINIGGGRFTLVRLFNRFLSNFSFSFNYTKHLTNIIDSSYSFTTKRGWFNLKPECWNLSPKCLCTHDLYILLQFLEINWRFLVFYPILRYYLTIISMWTYSLSIIDLFIPDSLPCYCLALWS